MPLDDTGFTPVCSLVVFQPSDCEIGCWARTNVGQCGEFIFQVSQSQHTGKRQNYYVSETCRTDVDPCFLPLSLQSPITDGTPSGRGTFMNSPLRMEEEEERVRWEGLPSHPSPSPGEKK